MSNRFAQTTLILCLATMLALTFGCATPGAGTREAQSNTDPWEGFNRGVYRFNDTLDRYALKPVAQGYQRVTPRPVRSGVSNFFGNLADVNTALNDVLQGKFVQGASDTGRVLVNTTAGIGGLFDVASRIGLEKHREDFGQTFAVWGVPEGPFVMLPFFGPRTLRGTAGMPLDSAVYPLNYMDLSWEQRTSAQVLSVVDTRAGLLAAERAMDAAALDRYSFLRDSYLQNRRALVNDGKGDVQSIENSGDELDALDEMDELDELDQLDELDTLDELDRLDDLDALDAGGAPGS